MIKFRGNRCLITKSYPYRVIDIIKIIDLNCPKKYLYTPKHPLWFRSRLKNLIFEKKINHVIYKRSPIQTNYYNFSNIHALCKRQNKIDYDKFISNTQGSTATNPKLFWKYINAKRLNSTLPTSCHIIVKLTLMEMKFQTLLLVIFLV